MRLFACPPSAMCPSYLTALFISLSFSLAFSAREAVHALRLSRLAVAECAHACSGRTFRVSLRPALAARRLLPLDHAAHGPRRWRRFFVFVIFILFVVFFVFWRAAGGHLRGISSNAAAGRPSLHGRLTVISILLLFVLLSVLSQTGRFWQL